MRHGNGKAEEASEVSPKFIKDRSKLASPVNWATELLQASELPPPRAFSRKRGSLAPESRRGVTQHQPEQLGYFEGNAPEDRLLSPQQKPTIILKDYVKLQRERDLGTEAADLGDGSRRH